MAFTIRPPEPAYAWPTELVERVSSTSLSTFRRCPEQWRRRYLLGEKIPPPINAIWGKSDHAGIEYSLRQKIGSGIDLPVDDVMDVASEFWKQEVELYGGPSEIDYGRYREALGELASPGDLAQLDVKLRNEMLRLCALYHDQVSPSLDPLAVEQEFEVEFEELPVPLYGYVDIVLETGIRERKTAASSRKELPGDWRAQGLRYMAATGKPVSWDISLKQKQPQVRELAFQLPYSDQAVRLARQSIARVVEQIWDCLFRFGRDEPWPDAIEHAWACQYCGYRPSCHWWGND